MFGGVPGLENVSFLERVPGLGSVSFWQVWQSWTSSACGRAGKVGKRPLLERVPELEGIRLVFDRGAWIWRMSGEGVVEEFGGGVGVGEGGADLGLAGGGVVVVGEDEGF